MRKLIGGIAIIIFLYLGFFGSEKHNVEPFIANWWNSEKSEGVKDELREAGNNVSNKLRNKTKEVTDSVATKTASTLNESLLKY